MSGFAPEWLSLREGADHRARNGGLLAALGRHFSARDAVTVVDLGAGLGSNLRATAPVLPARQHWVLVDHDPVLLAGACDAIASWADQVRPATAGLEVTKADRSIRVEVRHADLGQGSGRLRRAGARSGDRGGAIRSRVRAMDRTFQRGARRRARAALRGARL